MSELSNGSEITVLVEETMKEEDDEREVYRISYEANGIRFSQIDKPKTLMCFICKGPFVNPIVTKCNHFFCETCAQKKKEKCFVCAEPTSGIFEHKMRLFIRNPVEPEKKAEEREIARAKKKEVLETLSETLEYTNGWKRKMSNGKKAVKIVEEVETFLKKAIQKATETRETEMGAFIMMKEAMATMKMFQVKLDKAFEVMVNMKRNV